MTSSQSKTFNTSDWLLAETSPKLVSDVSIGHPNRWVKQQQASKRDELWLDGAQDYISHAKKLLEDFKEVVSNSQLPAAAKCTLLMQDAAPRYPNDRINTGGVAAINSSGGYFGTALAVGRGPGLPTASSNDVQQPFAFNNAASTSGIASVLGTLLLHQCYCMDGFELQLIYASLSGRRA